MGVALSLEGELRERHVLERVAQEEAREIHQHEVLHNGGALVREELRARHAHELDRHAAHVADTSSFGMGLPLESLIQAG